MTKTTNYGLPQWEGSDRVLRTDFNEAMADIDAALQANADAVTELSNRSRFTKLKEVSVAENTLTVEIDLSDVDWSKWSNVYLDCITNNVDQANLYYNTTEQSHQRFYVAGMWGLTHRPRLTFRVGFDSQRLVDAVWGTISHVDEISYSGLQKLIIFGDTMSPGAVFTLWGEA